MNTITSETAISTFGYENCFKIVAMDDGLWSDFTAFYHGDKSAVNRDDYACVRSLFYCEPGCATFQATRFHLGAVM